MEYFCALLFTFVINEKMKSWNAKYLTLTIDFIQWRILELFAISMNGRFMIHGCMVKRAQNTNKRVNPEDSNELVLSISEWKQTCIWLIKIFLITFLINGNVEQFVERPWEDLRLGSRKPCTT